MPRNYYVGKSQSELESMLSDLQAEMEAGGTVTSGGGGEMSFGIQGALTIDERWRRIYYALYLLDPDTYPITGMRRTSVVTAKLYLES